MPEHRPMTEIEFCAWLGQAMPGDRLEYYQGFLIVDAFPPTGWPPSAFQQGLARLRSRVFQAAELGLVHLVQQRLDDDRFSYIAIARPRPRQPAASLLVLLEEEAAA